MFLPSSRKNDALSLKEVLTLLTLLAMVPFLRVGEDDC